MTLAHRSDDAPKRFVGFTLVANTAIIGLGTGAAMMAATDNLLYSAAAAVIGGYIGFLLIKDIPDGGK
ncbi:MAG: hypothetical protein AAFY02_08890 [Pseudomonadota bacterium]